MLRAVLLGIALLLAATPAQGKKSLVIRKVAGADPLEAWFEAEDLVAQGDAAGALSKLRAALTEIQKRADDATVGGPGGATWRKREAAYHYAMKAGEVAAMISWREAATLYEQAVKSAENKEDRTKAELQVEAARAQVKAGNAKAPSFLGDDPARLVDDPSTAPMNVEGDPKK